MDMTKEALKAIGRNRKKDVCEACGDVQVYSPIKDKMYAECLETRDIIINGTVGEDLIEKVVVPILMINADDDAHNENTREPERPPIKLLINTFGGSAHECLSIVSAIETSRTPVITIALGKACSAGFFILAAGHHRLCQKYTTLMYHQVSSGSIGKLAEHVDEVEELQRLQDMVDGILIRRSKLTKAKLKKIHDRKFDWHISPAEALELGIVDDII